MSRYRKLYPEKELRKLVKTINQLRTSVTLTDNAEEIQIFLQAADILSLQLVKWLRKTYPGTFRVFEFNGPGQPKEDPLLTESSMEYDKDTLERLEVWMKKHNFKHHDIIIYHPTSKYTVNFVYYIASKYQISFCQYIRGGKLELPYLLLKDMLQYGLTQKAMQQLYFPDGGFPLFTGA